MENITPIKTEPTLQEKFDTFQRIYSHQCTQLGDLTYQIDRFEAAAGELKVKMLNNQHDGHKIKQLLDKETQKGPNETN